MSSLQTAVLLLALVLLFVSSFLAMAETSLSRIDTFRAQALADEGRRGSPALLKLLQSPEHFAGHLNSLLLLLLASQIVWATAIADLLFHFVNGPLFFIAVVIEIGVGYVIAEALPKTLAIQHTERAALLSAPIIAGLSRVLPMRLLTRPLIGFANVLAPGRGLKQGPFIYEQQILAIADSAAAEKLIERDEHELIHSVIEFGSTVAREVMIPRTDMVTVQGNATAAQAMDVAIARGFSRFPVHGEEGPTSGAEGTRDESTGAQARRLAQRGSGDAVTGVLFTKDLMRVLRDGHRDRLVAEVQREAKYIPETKRVAELLREMQLEKNHMAIVVDEHGSVVGLITLEDLLEEVVGEITDEYDAEELPQIEKLGSLEWRVDARLPIDEVNEQLGVMLPHGDWDTLGGLLIDTFERVPARGESTELGDYRVWVEQTSGRRVTRVRIKVKPQPQA
jgi:putative hemolysin